MERRRFPRPIDAAKAQRPFDDLTARKDIHHALLAIAEGGNAAPRVLVSGPARPDGPPMAPATVFAGDRDVDLPLTLASVRDLYSTGADLITFLQALVTSAAFDDPATGQALQAVWRPFGFPLDPTAQRQPKWPIEYARGMMRLQLPWLLDPRRRVPPIVGHTGSTGTWAFHCAEFDLYLAGTVDQATAGPVPFSFVPQLLRELAA
jgi:D-alanyl-D-alanine carboxypeptidase